MAETSAEGRRFFRLVISDPPAETDFRSQEALGRKARPNLTPVEMRAFRDGVSVQDSESGARALASKLRANPRAPNYQFIAVIDVPLGSSIHCDDAIGPPGHWTLFGSPKDLLASVTSPLIVL